MSKQPTPKKSQHRRSRRGGGISPTVSALHFLLDHAAVQNPDFAAEAKKHKVAVELEHEAEAAEPAADSAQS